MTEQEFALLCGVVFVAVALPWWIALGCATACFIIAFTGGKE